MTPQDPNDVPAGRDPENPEAAMRDARRRFLEAFPNRSASIGLMLSAAATNGERGPVEPLRHIVHRMAGLAGMVGLPTVSARARELDELLEGIGLGALDASRASLLLQAIEQAFTDDLSNPPEWAGPNPASGGNRRVMVVEDDEGQREVVSINLAAAGYVPISVHAGDTVLAVARAQQPDIILLDANLPGVSGSTICRLLKADPALAATPVLLMTTPSGLDDRLTGLAPGADDYLVKPIDMSELMCRIQILLARRAQAASSAASREVSSRHA